MAKSKLYLNGINIESVKLGTSDVKLYLGDTLVYPLGPSVNVTYDVATYDGNPQVAENIVVTDKSGNTLVENVDYVVTENNGGTNAGNYPLVLTFMGQYTGTVTTSFIINKVNPTVTAPTAITRLVYNASGQTLVNGGSTDYGTLKYSLDNVTYDTTIPSGTNASSYTVYYKVEGDSNVNDVSEQNFVVNIAKVTPTVVAPTAKVLTYNTQAQELVNAGSTDYGTLKYSLDNTTWSTSIPTATNYGSYTVYYKVEGDSNINDVAAQSVACSINEKQVTATVELSQSAYIYNGSACEPTVTVKDGGTVIDPSEYTVTYSNNVNAGTATVTISDNVGGNYEVIGSATFTINKADVTYTAPTTVSSLVYNGNAQELLNAGTVTGGTIKYSTDNVNWSTDIPSGTNATSYTSYWKIDGDANHNDIASSSIVTTIAKADSSLSFAVTEITVGVGETKTNVVTVNAGDGTLTYTSDNTSAITVDNSGVISGVSVGNATITANISQTQNYNAASASYSANSLIAIVTNFNVTDTTNSTKIANTRSNFSAIEIDGVIQPSVVSAYTFDTTGNHTVKYYLTDPTIVESNTFYGCYNLESVIIPDTVTSIGNFAFSFCSGLTSVTIPDSVTSIDHDAFRFCVNLKSINSNIDGVANLPTGLTTIEYGLFSNCYSLETVSVPSGVTTIGSTSFGDCSGLTSINIPDGVTGINNQAFMRCYNLESIEIPSSVTRISDTAFTNCYSLTSVTFGENSQLATIGNSAFANCDGLESIDIPDSVTRISGRTFEGCDSLTSVTIGSGVTYIGGNAFSGCTSLTSVTVEAITPPTLYNFVVFDDTNNCPIYVPCDSVDAYKAAQYWSVDASRIEPLKGTCPLTAKFSVTSTTSATRIEGINSGFTQIAIDGVTMASTTSYTFSSTGEHTVKYGLSDPTTIQNQAFQYCQRMTSVEIPDNITSIGDDAFTQCHALTSVYFGEDSQLTELGEYSFSNCENLTNITLPNNLTTIDMSAFSACRGLRRINIPDSVTSIGRSAFQSCSGLTSVTIPSGVTYIGQYAFYQCSGLTSVTVNATTPPSLNNGGESYYYTFAGSYPIYVPCESLSSYLNHNEWSYFSSRIVGKDCPITVTAKINVVDTSSPTRIMRSTTPVTTVIIDGVELTTAVATGYTFTTLGEHTVGYKLKDVTKITTNLLSGMTNVTSVEISDTVATIGSQAFQDCTNLASVTIGDGVTSISGSAFYNCTGLTSVTMGSSVTYIGQRAFAECSGLTSVTIPDSVTNIYDQAFQNCTSLTSVTIGSGMTKIYRLAFSYCTSLTSITVNSNTPCEIEGNPFGNTNNCPIYVPSCSCVDLYTAASGWSSYRSRITALDCEPVIGIFNITDTTNPTQILYKVSSFTKVEIDGVEQPSVTANYTFDRAGEHTVTYYLTAPQSDVGFYAFGGSEMTSVIIPDSVKTINDYAFSNCTGLTSVTIPDSVTTIKNSFNNCYGLTSIGLVGSGASLEIPDSVTSLGSAFYACSGLTSVTIPDSVTSLESSVFKRCTNLTSCTIGSGVTSIGTSAFTECSGLTSIAIPDSVTSIGDYAFSRCFALSSCTIGSGVTSIGIQAFYDCELLENVNIPDGVTSIGENAFQYCYKITSITIPSGVTTINNYTFSGCRSLTSITIPDNVTSIGNSAFNNCSGLTTCIIGDGVTSIGSSAFRACSGMTSCTIGSSVITIGASAFTSCYGLINLTIPDSVTTISDSAFSGCRNITSIVIPDSVTSIDNYAFAYCYALANLTIGSGVTSIGNYAFTNCDGLTYVTIPDNVTSVGVHTFSNCSHLSGCTIGSGITAISDNMFYWTPITSITIPNTVTSIGVSAFNVCTKLTNIDIPDSVTSIGNSAFNGCTSLTSVTIGSSVTEIGSQGFYGCSILASITSNAMTAPTVSSDTFRNVKTNGTLTVPQGSSGYDVWMGTGNYYLGKYNWTKVEQ